MSPINRYNMKQDLFRKGFRTRARIYLVLSLTAAVLFFSIMSCHAQTWAPSASPKTAKASKNEVQCWGETVKHAQCKRMVDPSKAYKGPDGHYYCYQHAPKKAK